MDGQILKLLQRIYYVLMKTMHVYEQIVTYSVAQYLKRNADTEQ